MKKSGKDIGAEYLARMEAFLAATPRLPVSASGTLSIKAIAEAANIPSQSIYKNPAIRALLDSAKESTGLKSWAETKRTDRENVEETAHRNAATSSTSQSKECARTVTLERRLHKMEQQNAALVAENAELRRQLKALRLQMGREDMTIETGRRIPVPPGAHA